MDPLAFVGRIADLSGLPLTLLTANSHRRPDSVVNVSVSKFRKCFRNRDVRNDKHVHLVVFYVDKVNIFSFTPGETGQNQTLFYSFITTDIKNKEIFEGTTI